MDPGPKRRIVVLADGTGNSAGKLFRTNVWRLYQAVDTGHPADDLEQRVCYHDGVGTSSFKPLAIAGGAFGWGLKRNLLDLYMFVCRNYRPGDDILAFGFSRGAFTIRLLVALIATQGVVQCATDEALSRYARDAYRRYRRRFGAKRRIVRLVRDARDRVIAGWRRLWRQPTYAEIAKQPVPEIAFVGVWDTVAAYGMPIAELTRGIDQWLMPLSMPNYQLSEKVRVARHALSLDDERDTFHPLLWDELHERALAEADPRCDGRLRQVWFAGMHSDVGGGYPDDSLALVPLHWMMREAAAHAGLRYRPGALEEIARAMNPCGPMHDSRRGLAGYYRYQPRKISARLEPGDPAALIMQDPNRDPPIARLVATRIHHSVAERMARGSDAYAPIVLPAVYEIVHPDGGIRPCNETPAAGTSRADRQEWVWNIVWLKRVLYAATLILSLVLASLPLWADGAEAACLGPACMAVPVLSVVRQVLPVFAGWWIDAFQREPGIFLGCAGGIAALLLWSGTLERRIEGMMGALLRPTVASATETGAPPQGRPGNWIYRLRTHDRYQSVLRAVKWRWAPSVAGLLILLAAIGIGSWLTLAVLNRSIVAVQDGAGLFCGGDGVGREGSDVFEPRALCWHSGFRLKAGQHYRLTLSIPPAHGWRDLDIPADPHGFAAARMGWGLGYVGAPFRRSLSQPWFRLLVRVGPTGPVIAPAISRGAADGVYHATFTAGQDGELHLFVNDMLTPWNAVPMFYANNQGQAVVTIQRAD